MKLLLNVRIFFDKESMKHALFFLIFTATTSWSFDYVQSANDYASIHMEAHTKRMAIMAEELHRKFPQYLSKKDLKTLLTFIGFHDLSKKLSLEDLRAQFQYTGDETIASRLFQNYGNPPGMDLAKLKETIKELNRIDNEIALIFKKELQLSDEAFERLKSFEHILDLVDRGQDPVAAEEFGKSMKTAREFAGDRLSKEELKMAEYLEKNYAEITQGHSFYDTKVKNPSIKSCLLPSLRIPSL